MWWHYILGYIAFLIILNIVLALTLKPVHFRHEHLLETYPRDFVEWANWLEYDEKSGKYWYCTNSYSDMGFYLTLSEAYSMWRKEETEKNKSK